MQLFTEAIGISSSSDRPAAKPGLLGVRCKRQQPGKIPDQITDWSNAEGEQHGRL
jgi:hypothetical protein